MDENAPGYVSHPLHEVCRLPETDVGARVSIPLREVVSVPLPAGYRANAVRVEIVAIDERPGAPFEPARRPCVSPVPICWTRAPPEFQPIVLRKPCFPLPKAAPEVSERSTCVQSESMSFISA
jgi:hypothetical protein